jgi:hypothetical protein
MAVSQANGFRLRPPSPIQLGQLVATVIGWGGSPTRRRPRLSMVTHGGRRFLLKGVFMAFIVPPLTSEVGGEGTQEANDGTRWRRQCDPTLAVLAATLGLFFQGAMCDMTTYLHLRLPRVVIILPLSHRPL